MLRRVITSAITRAHLRAVTVVIVVIAATVLSSAPYLTSAQTPGPCEPPNAPCTIWPSTQVPAVLAKNDANAVELGVKFRSDVAGYISGIRFFKSSQNTGTHIGSLWSATGTLVASAAFTNETASGWQQVNFPSPIQIAANTTYVASYHTNTGFYSANENYFATSGFNSPPLRALANGVDGLNGVYRYGATAFPNQSFNSTNYWVDVVFVTSLAPDTTPPIVQSTTPAPNATNVNIAATVTATFNEAMSASSIGPSSFELRDSGSNVVAAIITYDAATRTASLQPSATLAYSSTYSARVRGGVTGVEDVAGNSLTSGFVWTFTTSPVPTPLGCPCSIWLPSQAPVQAAEPDAGPFELGLKFRSDVAGYITGVRFYKSLQNTGTHVGNLWTAAGAQLATATFTGESASGWQEVLFQNPVAIAANS
jgi:hypothetical protein